MSDQARVSTHTKFNPEGVKGKAATPPHNFFKIMAKFPKYHVTISVKDANTQIELRQMQHTIIGRGGSERAEWRAIEQAKDFVLEFWARDWWYRHYLITATQFDELVKDGMINPLRVWDFKVISCDRMPDVEIYFDE